MTEQIRAGAPYKGSVFIHVTLPMTVAPNRPSDIFGRVPTIHGTEDVVTPVLCGCLSGRNDGKWRRLADNVVWRCAPRFRVRDANDQLQRFDQKLCDQTYRLMRDFFDETSVFYADIAPGRQLKDKNSGISRKNFKAIH